MHLSCMRIGCMKCEIFNECILVWENKSLTNVGEFVKSRTAIEEYVCLQTLPRMFSPGVPVLLFEENSVGGY